jgi:hypothetical protein
MTIWNFYFQIFEKAVGKEEIITFLSYPPPLPEITAVGRMGQANRTPQSARA